MGLLDLEASDGEARPRIPPRASHEVPHATRDRGRARPGHRPAGELRQGGDRDPRAALVPRRELQLARGHGIARVHRVDREPPRESGPPRSLEGEGREARWTLGLRLGLRRDRCAWRIGMMPVESVRPFCVDRISDGTTAASSGTTETTKKKSGLHGLLEFRALAAEEILTR